MNKYLLLTIFLLSFFSSFSQSNIEWEKAYGSTGNDKFHGIVATQDGNYVAMGIADSMNGDVGCTLKGQHDEWVIKIDPLGNIIWQTCLGGTKEEEQPHNRVIATSDGGFLTAGETWSFDFNSTGNHGQCDVLLVKLNANGHIEWTRVLGGQERDTPRFLYELPGKKYLVMARTNSTDGDIPFNTLANYNTVVFKIDNNGATLNTSLYGGSGIDELWAVTYTKNKYVYAGHTNSTDLGAIDTCGWLMTTDTNGVVLKSWLYGSGGNQKFLDMVVVNDTQFIACGEKGNPVDFWAMKLTLRGKVLWDHVYGGGNAEIFKSATRLNQGVYLTGGTSSSGNGKKDCYIVKIKFSGKQLWDLTLGGTKMDWANQVTKDGYMAGYIESSNGDITGYHGGPSDGWIVKIIPPVLKESDDDDIESAESEKVSMDLYPNPFSNELSISVSFPEKSSGTISLFDITGKQIQKIKEGEFAAGINNISLNRNGLSQGVYFIQLHTSSSAIVKEIILN